MRIMRELERIDFFQGFDESKHELLKEIPNADYRDYLSKVLIIDGVSYTPRYYLKNDVLIVGYYDDNKEGLYITTDYKGRPETFEESDPKCPVCGQTYSDAFELADEDEIECPNCYAHLSVERVIDISYTTTLISKGEVIDLDKEGEKKNV